MNTYAPYFPFRTEHIGTMRCQTVRDYAASNQIFCRECVVADGDKPRLRKLDAVLSQGIANRVFDALSDDASPAAPALNMSVQPHEPDGFCLHAYCQSDAALLSTIWRQRPARGGRLKFELTHICAFGFPKRDPIDMAFDYLDALREALRAKRDYGVDLHLDSQNGELSFDAAGWILAYMTQQTPMRATISGGKTLFRAEKDRFSVKYDICAPEDSDDFLPIGTRPRRKVLCTQFYRDGFGNEISGASDAIGTKAGDMARSGVFAPLSSDPSSEMRALLNSEARWSLMEQIRACGMRACHGDENWLFSDDAEGGISLSPSMSQFEDLGVGTEKTLSLEYADTQCPTAEAIHRAALAGEVIAPEAARLAIGEVAAHLPSVMLPPFLHMLHVWAPQLGDIIRPEVLSISSETDDLPILADILMRIYYNEHNYTMLLALLQRMINNSALSPRGTIRFGLEYVNILTRELSMHSMAFKRLDALKPIVQSHGNSQEIAAFALACHRAQHSGVAIQFLHGMLKKTHAPQAVAQIGLMLTHIMLEHNEPMQSVINACKRILADNPRHPDSLEIMAQCYERSKLYEDAAEAYQQCFDYYIGEWESKQFESESDKTMPTGGKAAYYAPKCIRLAEKLEELYEITDNRTFGCIVLRRHMQLEPTSAAVLSRLLKALEAEQSYHEMAQAGLRYLSQTEGISADNEIAIRLTLYNLYEGALCLPAEAERQLAAARQICPSDPRVISAEIDRCRKYGYKEEEIGHRLALIDVLPPKEAVDETLLLVRQYEALQTPISQIADLLRRVNSRIPNNLLILLELRQYLRKIGQSFELATVLERLARVTPDLQTRKSILLEASEVHDKLGNHSMSQALYHEAQLCSPIDPTANTSLMNDKIRSRQRELSADCPKAQSSHILSALAAVVLTSKSISVVGDAIDAGAASRADRTLSGACDVSELSRIAERDGARSEESICDANAPIEEQILDARLRGNSHDLLECLLKSIDGVGEDKQPPRILQEIGCIYLYDFRDFETAQKYLERASALSEEVAGGEQTLNALENIYQKLHQYENLARIVEKKIFISAMPEERRRYEIRLAQIRYEYLGETDLAAETMRRLLKQNPENETALQLLAQIYIDTQQTDKAIAALESVTPILEPNSKQMAQHMLRIIALYIESDRIADAKRELRRLFDANDYVDKLAVLEHYKRICREHDEWEEQLDLLREELCYYLKRPKSDCRIGDILSSNGDRLLSGVAEHTLREYADVCYYKLQRIKDAADIYAWLIRRNPDDAYANRILGEIAESHPGEVADWPAADKNATVP